MKIEVKDFILESEDTARDRFTLYRKIRREKHIKNKPTGEFYDTIDTVGYSYRLESAMEMMIKLLLHEKDDTVTLKEYLRRYMEIKKEIRNILT